MVLIERCSCGAELLPELHFCVGCGAHREDQPRAVPAERRAAPAGFGTLPSRALPAVSVPAVSWPGTGYVAAAALPPVYAPAPVAARSSAPWIAGSAAIVVVAVLAAVAVLALRPPLIFGAPVGPTLPLASSTSSSPSTSSSSSSSLQPSVSNPPAATPADSSPSTSPVSATVLLGEQVDRDRTAVDSVTDSWVPQLSSKRPGTVAGGVTYDADAILTHYQVLAATYPGAALLWSGDWPVFKGHDYWVVIVAQPFATAAQANAWCDAQGFGADDCLAKKLSHSGGPQGTTVPRQ